MNDSGYTVDRNGRPVRVKRLPPRGKAKTLFKGKKQPYDGSTSPFERFSETNSAKSKITSL